MFRLKFLLKKKLLFGIMAAFSKGRRGMKTKRTGNWIFSARSAVAALAAFCVAAGFADEDPYASYVKLKSSDASNNHSFNRLGHWDDTEGPVPSKNYYVPSGKMLYVPDGGGLSTWEGGQLAIAGEMRMASSGGPGHAVTFNDLVLLPGGYVRHSGIAPFDGTATIKGTAGNPSAVYHGYSSALKVIRLAAKFHGDASSYLILGHWPAAYETGYFYQYYSDIWENYLGTVLLSSPGLSYFPENVGMPLNIPGTFAVTNEAHLYLYRAGHGIIPESPTLGGLELCSGGNLHLLYDLKGGSFLTTVTVTNHLYVSEDANIDILSTNKTTSASVLKDSFFVGIETDGQCMAKSLFAHLTDEAAASAPIGWWYGFRGPTPSDLPVPRWAMKVEEGENGQKDVYLAYTNLVRLLKSNGTSDNTTSGFNPANTAYWSNGVIPSSDSTYDYYVPEDIALTTWGDCIVNLPNATVSFGKGAKLYNKAAGSWTVKELNFAAGSNMGIWSGGSTRSIDGGTVNILSGDSRVSFYVFQGKSITINSTLCGAGHLAVLSNSDAVKGGEISFNAVNTNFTGKLTFYCVAYLDDGNAILSTTLRDARNWGGVYSGDDPNFAVTVSNGVHVSVVNDVTLSEPTRGLCLRGPSFFDVAGGRTFTLRNPLTWSGEFVKTGTGTLDLGGTSHFADDVLLDGPMEGSNVLSVAEGALRISSNTAADGLAISFAEGTKLVIPAGSEKGYFNTKWDAPLAINTDSGKLPVEIELSGDEGTADIEVPICTFNATAADALSPSAFKVSRLSNGHCLKSLEKRTNQDGSVSFVAKMGRVGARFIIR